MSTTPPGAVTAASNTTPASATRYIEDPSELIAGNRVQLLRHGREVFPAWLAAIDAARDRISLEMYIFADDVIGRAFGDALARAARRGVRVRLLYDFVGCLDTSPEFFLRLREAGVHVIVYHSYRIWRPRFWALFRRNHRKTLVCDGRVAFAGGVNIADDWNPRELGGSGWHDAALRVEGPAVPVIEGIFLRTWNHRARRRMRLKEERLGTQPVAGDTRVAVVRNTELLERFAIRRSALHAIRESGERVYLANPYFIPDPGVVRALGRAAGRGVDVRVLVPERGDHWVLDYAARATFGKLLGAGVRIFQHSSVVHTKMLLTDRDFVSLGSYNIDHRSLSYNLELVVNVLDRRCNADAAAMFEDDLAGAGELDLGAFADRSLVTRVLERLAYSLRRWL